MSHSRWEDIRKRRLPDEQRVDAYRAEIEKNQRKNKWRDTAIDLALVIVMVTGLCIWVYLQAPQLVSVLP